MAAKKSSPKRSSASRPMNKKAMKRTKGGSTISVVPSAMKINFADGSVRVGVENPTTLTLKQ